MSTTTMACYETGSVRPVPPKQPDPLTAAEIAEGERLADAVEQLQNRYAEAKRALDLEFQGKIEDAVRRRNNWIVRMFAIHGDYYRLPAYVARIVRLHRTSVHAIIRTGGQNIRTRPDRDGP